jgi:hypothetical protein
MVRLPCAKAEAESRARHHMRRALAAFAFEKTVDKNIRLVYGWLVFCRLDAKIVSPVFASSQKGLLK